MRTRIPAASAAALLLPALAAPVHAAQWVRVDTPNFVVYGESGERRVRAVANDFERFREALGRVLPNVTTTAAVPTPAAADASCRNTDLWAKANNGSPGSSNASAAPRRPSS